ncbi:hypothetical protein AURDEDRAFT_162388 [Auricularia subglabra TFB-10046 SS5]|nr:hypothetical protein AURDEDRAFT_162388 [Auricularia subglabra TFB-10046 SS5]
MEGSHMVQDDQMNEIFNDLDGENAYTMPDDRVFEALEPMEVDSDTDHVSTALPYWCAWPNLRRPSCLVRTNRDLVPELPPERSEERQLCVDGRYGLLEASQLPQMHDPAEWPLVFVPLREPGATDVPLEVGRPWWHLEHDDVSGDLGWFRLADEHMIPSSKGLFKLAQLLRNRIETTEAEEGQRWDLRMTRSPYERLPAFPPPVKRRARFLELGIALRQHSLTKWELYVQFADWQRCLNEIRGWMTFFNFAINKDLGLGSQYPVLQHHIAAQRAKKYIETRHTGGFRGVFTRDLNVAMVCAAFDIPVWLLEPFRPALLEQLRQKQADRTLRRAFYRKYGSDRCGHVQAIERSYHEVRIPVADLRAFSLSKKAYADALWNAEEGANPLDDGPPLLYEQGPVDPVPPVPSTSSSVNRDPRLRLAELMLLSRVAPPLQLAAASSSVPNPPPVQPGDQGKKRQAEVSVSDAHAGQGSAKKKKKKNKKNRSAVGKLLKEQGSSMKPSEVLVTGPEVSPFNTSERPFWFPSPYYPADAVLGRVDVGRQRQVALAATSEFPVRAHISAKGRLHKVPLLSYFLNAWAESQKEDFNKPKAKGGVTNPNARPQAEKLPGENVTLSLYNWAKLRGYYLRRLESSEASDCPGMAAPDWRKTIRMMLPVKFTARAVALLGLDVILLQKEPRRILAPEPEQDGVDDETAEDTEPSAPVPQASERRALPPPAPPSSTTSPPKPTTSAPVHQPPAIQSASQSRQYREDDSFDSDYDDYGEEIDVPEYELVAPELHEIFDIAGANDAPLRTPAQRGQVEPEDWYFKDINKRQLHKLTKFTYYYPSTDDQGLVMIVISRDNPYFKYVNERSVEWWDYGRRSIYLLPRSTASMGSEGERVMKPMRFTSARAKANLSRRRVWPEDWDGCWSRRGLTKPVPKPKAQFPSTQLSKKAMKRARQQGIQFDQPAAWSASPSLPPTVPRGHAAVASAWGPSFSLPLAAAPVRSLPSSSWDQPAPVASTSSQPFLSLPPAAESTSSSSSLPPSAPPAAPPSVTMDAEPMPLPDDVSGYLDLLPHPTFDGHELPPWIRTEDAIWPSVSWRQYILWELGELEFRYELFFVDLVIRQSHPDSPALIATADDRYAQCKACWGGSDFIPGVDPKSNNKLCDNDARERLRALYAFFKFMRPWPRTAQLLQTWETFLSNGGDLDGVGAGSELFHKLEASIWHCYAQIYFDYRHRLPVVPHVRPEMPVY